MRISVRSVVILVFVFALVPFFATGATAQCAWPTPWAADTYYAAGALVSYIDHGYECLQSHTSQVGWEPPNTPSLWQDQGLLADCTPTPTARPTARPTATSTATATQASSATPTNTATPTPTTSGQLPPPRATSAPGVTGCVEQPTPCRISWTAVGGAAAYNVYSSQFSPPGRVATVTALEYYSTRFGLSYYIAATTADGAEGFPSNWATCNAYVSDCVPCTYPAWDGTLSYASGAGVKYSSNGSYYKHQYKALRATMPGEVPGVSTAWQQLSGLCAP